MYSSSKLVKMTEIKNKSRSFLDWPWDGKTLDRQRSRGQRNVCTGRPSVFAPAVGGKNVAYDPAAGLALKAYWPHRWLHWISAYGQLQRPLGAVCGARTSYISYPDRRRHSACRKCCRWTGVFEIRAWSPWRTSAPPQPPPATMSRCSWSSLLASLLLGCTVFGWKRRGTMLLLFRTWRVTLLRRYVCNATRDSPHIPVW